MVNPILGFGAQPAGISAAGLGTPLGLPTPGSTYETVADLTPARSIDLAASDYAVDTETTGAPHGAWSPKSQRVVLLLATRRNRLPYALDLGNAFLNLDRAPDDVQSSARLSAEAALKDMLEAGEVAIESVEAFRDGGTVIEAVTWIDLATGQATTTATR